MNRVIWLFVIASCFTVLGSVDASGMDSRTADEIEHLLKFIDASPCRFNRNGSWYNGGQAAEHIARKFRYALGKGLIKKTEDFIAYAATKSSLSGKRYRVTCGEAAETGTAEWLNRELEAYRSAAGP